MNKNFEMGKIWLTLAGFLFVTSGMFMNAFVSRPDIASAWQGFMASLITAILLSFGGIAYAINGYNKETR